jgi:phenylacetyl-CoA:acceptor oxidoreductase 26-kDa subunit
MEPSQKQSAWQVPALLNLILGGLGAGFYVITLLTLPQNGGWTQSPLQCAVIKLLGPAFVSLGLVSLTTEAGHPLNSIYLLTNLRRSWMSREALAAGVFIIAAGLDWLVPNLILQGVAAVAGLVFIFSQGMLVLRASGVITWNVPIIPWFFLTSGLATGAGMLLIIVSFLGMPSLALLSLVALVIAIVNTLVWVAYLNTSGEAFQRAIKLLRQTNNLALTIGLGHLLPIVLLIAALVQPQTFLVVIAGLALIIGGASQKFGLAFQASVLRGLVRG